MAITGQLMLNPSSLNIANFNQSCEEEQRSRRRGWDIRDFLVVVSTSYMVMRLAKQTKSPDVWNGDSGARHPAHQIQIQRFTLPTQMTLVTRNFVVRGIPIPTAANRLRHYSSQFQSSDLLIMIFRTMLTGLLLIYL